MIGLLKRLSSDEDGGLKGEEVKVLDTISNGEEVYADCLIMSRNKRITVKTSNLDEINI